MTAAEAAHTAIELLERGSPIGTDVLAVLCTAVGQSADALRRRRRSGLCCLTNSQRILAIGELQKLARATA